VERIAPYDVGWHRHYRGYAQPCWVQTCAEFCCGAFEITLLEKPFRPSALIRSLFDVLNDLICLARFEALTGCVLAEEVALVLRRQEVVITQDQVIDASKDHDASAARISP
jgi:hypothetical protein